MGIDMALSPARALFRYWHAIFGLHQNQHRLDLSVGIKKGGGYAVFPARLDYEKFYFCVPIFLKRLPA